MIAGTVIGGDAVAARLGAMPAVLAAGLAQAADQLADALSDAVARNLSGGVLQQRSGRLAASIAVSVESTGSGVTATLGSASPYAAIHEYGGTIPPHTILPRNARALAFPWQGGERFLRRVSLPPVQMPERSFLRSALTAMAPAIRAGLTEAVRNAVSGRTAPT